jgi:hypothetical protein
MAVSDPRPPRSQRHEPRARTPAPSQWEWQRRFNPWTIEGEIESVSRFSRGVNARRRRHEPGTRWLVAVCAVLVVLMLGSLVLSAVMALVRYYGS